MLRVALEIATATGRSPPAVVRGAPPGRRDTDSLAAFAVERSRRILQGEGEAAHAVRGLLALAEVMVTNKRVEMSE